MIQSTLRSGRAAKQAQKEVSTMATNNTLVVAPVETMPVQVTDETNASALATITELMPKIVDNIGAVSAQFENTDQLNVIGDSIKALVGAGKQYLAAYCHGFARIRALSIDPTTKLYSKELFEANVRTYVGRSVSPSTAYNYTRMWDRVFSLGFDVSSPWIEASNATTAALKAASIEDPDQRARFLAEVSVGKEDERQEPRPITGTAPDGTAITVMTRDRIPYSAAAMDTLARVITNNPRKPRGSQVVTRREAPSQVSRDELIKTSATVSWVNGVKVTLDPSEPADAVILRFLAYRHVMQAKPWPQSPMTTLAGMVGQAINPVDMPDDNEIIAASVDFALAAELPDAPAETETDLPDAELETPPAAVAS